MNFCKENDDIAELLVPTASDKRNIAKCLLGKRPNCTIEQLLQEVSVWRLAFNTKITISDVSSYPFPKLLCNNTQKILPHDKKLLPTGRAARIFGETRTWRIAGTENYKIVWEFFGAYSTFGPGNIFGFWPCNSVNCLWHAKYPFKRHNECTAAGFISCR